MNSVKYIGMDVHKEAISIAVLNFSGKLVMECVIETKASTILQFIQGLSGSLHVTLEEGTWATWLYDRLKPHRFRTKRQLWSFGGLGIETHSSADHRYVDGQLQPSKKPVSLRGLNRNHNHELKNIFKGAAIIAATKPGPFQQFYAARIAKGIRPEMARLTLARKIAAITLLVWKKGVCFDAQHLKPQTA